MRAAQPGLATSLVDASNRAGSRRATSWKTREVTTPGRYIEATERFKRYLLDLREIAGLATTNQAFTVTEGVLLTFRRRLDPAGVARFAAVLPAVLCALFVSGWDPDATPVPFGPDDEMAAEVRALRAAHNYAEASSIRHVAIALRRNVDEAAFDAVLRGLPDGAVAFWSVE
jgi:uncharacterized protein (DUF2267 family)